MKLREGPVAALVLVQAGGGGAGPVQPVDVPHHGRARASHQALQPDMWALFDGIQNGVYNTQRRRLLVLVPSSCL